MSATTKALRRIAATNDGRRAGSLRNDARQTGIFNARDCDRRRGRHCCRPGSRNPRFPSLENRS